MRTFTAFNGVEYPVSDRFGAINLADGMTTDEARAVESRRRTLDNIARFLDGVSPDEALGLPAGTATIDQVHGNAWEPDTCGCRVLLVFDHYADPDLRQVRPHRTTRHCAAHTHLSDHASHCAELRAENSHKNRTVAEVATLLGVDPIEVKWSHDANRALAVSHKNLRAEDAAKLRHLARAVRIESD